MANSPASALVLRDGDRDALASLTRSTTIRAGLAMRARIVLLAAEGVANAMSRPRNDRDIGVEVAESVCQTGLAGLVDAPRAGRPKHTDDEQIIAATLQAPPKKYGVTPWS